MQSEHPFDVCKMVPKKSTTLRADVVVTENRGHFNHCQYRGADRCVHGRGRVFWYTGPDKEGGVIDNLTVKAYSDDQG